MTTDDTATDHPTGTAGTVLPSARTLGKGLAVLRVFMGTVLFANGLAKLFGFSKIEVGPYVGNLIDRPAMEFILRYEVFENPAGDKPGTSIGFVRPVAEFVLDNFTFFGWLITAGELVFGLLLILGLLTRLAALYGVAFGLSLALIYASSNRWVFEQPHEYVPFIILALIPTGRVWGLDGGVLRRRGTDPGELRGWPF
jgi:uncharacterized membrane protein YphA (DoxX/SURF4 family)